MSNEFSGFIAVFAGVWLFFMGIALALYLLRAYSVYRIAKRLDVESPWIAFIPVVGVFTLGRAAEARYDGKKTLPYGWILLGLGIGGRLISFFSFFKVASEIIDRIADTVGTPESWIEETASRLFGMITSTGLLSSLISVALTVFYFIALYKVCRLLAPDNAPLLVALSFIIRISEPVVLFCLRNKPICLGNVGTEDVTQDNTDGNF